ncbi:hypothetical protein Q3G72_002125 [Acer saccharum]|nr:hypothetical protein Q3G72_002125 [Acer saccharum]
MDVSKKQYQCTDGGGEADAESVDERGECGLDNNNNGDEHGPDNGNDVGCKVRVYSERFLRRWCHSLSVFYSLTPTITHPCRSPCLLLQQMVENAWRSDLHRRTKEQSALELARELHLTGDQRIFWVCLITF